MRLTRIIVITITLLAGTSPTVLAQNTDDIVEQLLRTSPESLETLPAGPVPEEEAQPALYRHFEGMPSVSEIEDALMPLPTVRDLNEIPRQQRRAAGLQINFPYNSDQITGDAAAKLKQIGSALNGQRLGTYRVALHGHTDAAGTDAYNLDLSRRRALAVQQFLSQTIGVPTGRLHVSWHGERAPRFSPGTNGNNRRVEFEIAGR